MCMCAIAKELFIFFLSSLQDFQCHVRTRTDSLNSCVDITNFFLASSHFLCVAYKKEEELFLMDDIKTRFLTNSYSFRGYF